MKRARISFIGAGPGAADLMTMRGARRIAEADVVLWPAHALAPECVQDHVRSGAELIDSSLLTRDEELELYRRVERDRLMLARVDAGDPALWGEVQERHDLCARMEIDVEVVPGVSAPSAAAAAVGRDLGVPELANSVVFARLEGGRSSAAETGQVQRLAEQGTTMALVVAAARTAQLVEELRAGGCADTTPVLVAYKVSCPDELLFRTTVGELEKTVKQHRLWRHALFVVGKAVSDGSKRPRPSHGTSSYKRSSDPSARRSYRTRRGPGARARTTASSGSDAGGGDSERADPVPVVETGLGQQTLRAPGQPDPGLAWWAVRDWQESARGAARAAVVRATERRGDEQSGLFAVAPESETAAADAATDSVTADAGHAAVSADAADPTVENVAEQSAPVDTSAEEPAAPSSEPAQQPAADNAAESESETAPRQTAKKTTKSTKATAKTAPASKSATKTTARVGAKAKTATKTTRSKSTTRSSRQSTSNKAKPTEES